MSKKLLAIVGAGASKELGLPIGRELKSNISNLLRLRFDDWGHKLERGDYAVCEALRHHGVITNGDRSVNPFIRDLHHISDAMPQAISIDHFINDQKGLKNIEVCGKLGIARAILQSEKSSILYLRSDRRDERIDFSKTEETWLNPFLRIITQSCTKDDLKTRLSSIALIVFNYDRCVEHFLFHWLQTYYKLSPAIAAGLVQEIEIYHPYGTIGLLPWQDQGGGVAFGADLSPEKLLDVASRIKTFTEGTDENSSEICGIRALVECSEKVVFLGFAYHKLNVDLLRLPFRPSVAKREIYGTAYGVSDVDIRLIQGEIATLFGCSVDFVCLRNDLVCHKIFDEFNRGLSVQ